MGDILFFISNSMLQTFSSINMPKKILKEIRFFRTVITYILGFISFISGSLKLWHCKNISFRPEMKTRINGL